MTLTPRDEIERLPADADLTPIAPENFSDELANTQLPDLPAVLVRIVELGRRMIPNAHHVTITSLNGRKARTLATSSDLAVKVDLAQYGREKGPCVHAARGDEPVMIEDLTVESRWPAFTSAALAQGLRSSLSMPLPYREVVTMVAVLNVYSRSQVTFTDYKAAEMVAQWGAVSLRHLKLRQETETLVAQTREETRARAVIEQAKGVLMNRHRISETAAFEQLVKLSQQHNRKVREIAAEVVNGR